MSLAHDHEPDPRLADWVDGAMSERDRERFVAELRVSPRLREELAAYERTVATLRQALHESAPEAEASAERVADRVLQRLQRAPAPVVPRSWSAGRLWLGLVAAAALLALAVWLDRWRAPRADGDTATDLVAQDDERARRFAAPEQGAQAHLAPQPAPQATGVESGPEQAGQTPAVSEAKKALPKALGAEPDAVAEKEGAFDASQWNSAFGLPRTREYRPEVEEPKPGAEAGAVAAGSKVAAPAEETASGSSAREMSRKVADPAASAPPPEVPTITTVMVDAARKDVAGAETESQPGADKSGAETPEVDRMRGVPSPGSPTDEMLPQIVLRMPAVTTKDKAAVPGAGLQRRAGAGECAAFLSVQFESLAAQERVKGAQSKDTIAGGVAEDRTADRIEPDAAPSLGRWTLVPDAVADGGTAPEIKTGSDDFYLGATRAAPPKPAERVWVVEGTREEIQSVIGQLARFAAERQIELAQGEVAAVEVLRRAAAPGVPPPAGPSTAGPAGPASGGPSKGASPLGVGGGRGSRAPTTPGAREPAGSPAAPKSAASTSPRLRIVLRLQLDPAGDERKR